MLTGSRTIFLFSRSSERKDPQLWLTVVTFWKWYCYPVMFVYKATAFCALLLDMDFGAYVLCVTVTAKWTEHFWPILSPPKIRGENPSTPFPLLPNGKHTTRAGAPEGWPVISRCGQPVPSSCPHSAQQFHSGSMTGSRHKGNDLRDQPNMALLSHRWGTLTLCRWIHHLQGIRKPWSIRLLIYKYKNNNSSHDML